MCQDNKTTKNTREKLNKVLVMILQIRVNTSLIQERSYIIYNKNQE